MKEAVKCKVQYLSKYKFAIGFVVILYTAFIYVIACDLQHGGCFLH